MISWPYAAAALLVLLVIGPARARTKSAEAPAGNVSLKTAK